VDGNKLFIYGERIENRSQVSELIFQSSETFVLFLGHIEKDN
jgi:hypothetical protein